MHCPVNGVCRSAEQPQHRNLVPTMQALLCQATAYHGRGGGGGGGDSAGPRAPTTPPPPQAPRPCANPPPPKGASGQQLVGGGGSWRPKPRSPPPPGGGGGGMAAWAPRPDPPPTHIRKLFPRGKNEIYQRSPKWRWISGTQPGHRSRSPLSRSLPFAQCGDASARHAQQFVVVQSAPVPGTRGEGPFSVEHMHTENMALRGSKGGGGGCNRLGLHVPFAGDMCLGIPGTDFQLDCPLRVQVRRNWGA